MKTLTKIMQMFGVARKETQQPRQTKDTISKPNPIPEADSHNPTSCGTPSSTISATLNSLPPHGKTALRNASRRLRRVGVLPTRTVPLITCQGSICQRCLTLSFKPTPSSPSVTSTGHYLLYEDEREKTIYFIPVPHPLPDSLVGSECSWRFSPYLGESFCSSVEECGAHALSLGKFTYAGARKFMYTGDPKSGAWTLLRSVKVSRHRTAVIDPQTEEHTLETLSAPNEHDPEPVISTSAIDEGGDSEEERNAGSHQPLSRDPPKIEIPEPCITSPPGVENEYEGQGSCPLLDANGDSETLLVTEDEVDTDEIDTAGSFDFNTSDIPITENCESHCRESSVLSFITEENDGVSTTRTPSTPSSLSSAELTILHTPLAAASSNDLLEVQPVHKSPSLPAVSRFFVNREAVWDRSQKENGDAAILSHDTETLLSETSNGIIQDEGHFSEPEPESQRKLEGRICLDCNTISLGTAAKIGYYVAYPSIDLDTAMLCFTAVLRDPVFTHESHEHSWLNLGTLEYRGDTEEEEKQYFDRCSISKYYVKAPEDFRAWRRITQITESGEVVKLEVSSVPPSKSSTSLQDGTSQSGSSLTEQHVTASICLRCGTLYFDPSAQDSDSSDIHYHMDGQYLVDLSVERGTFHFIRLPSGAWPTETRALIALRACDRWAFSASAVRCGPCLELARMGEMKLLAEGPELILDLELDRRGVEYQQAWEQLFSVLSGTKSPSCIQGHLCMTCGSMFFGLSIPNSGHGHYLPYMDFPENILRFLCVPPGIPGTLLGETRSGQWVLTPKDVEQQCEHEMSELGEFALDSETDELGHVVFRVKTIRDIPAWDRLLSTVFAAEERQIHQTVESMGPSVQSQAQQAQVGVELPEREAQDHSKGSSAHSRRPLPRRRAAFVVEERPNPENKLGRRSRGSHMSPGLALASGSSQAAKTAIYQSSSYPFRDRLQEETPGFQPNIANDRADTPMDLDGSSNSAAGARACQGIVDVFESISTGESRIQGHTIPWTPCNQHCTVSGEVPRIDFTWPWENILHLPHPSVPPIYLLGLLAKDRERLFALGHGTVVLYRLGQWSDIVWVPVDESDDTPGSMVWSIVRKLHAMDDGSLWQILALDEMNWFWHWLPRSAQIAYERVRNT